MKKSTVRALSALVGSVLLAGAAHAQYPIRTGGGRTSEDRDPARRFQIKRRTVSGRVKSVDTEKKTFVVAGSKETAVDVGPSLIKAGKGSATVNDIKVGDRVKVFGEATVQGGIRAMEITLPSERMSIPPLTSAERKARELALSKPKEPSEPAAEEKPKEEKKSKKSSKKSKKDAEKTPDTKAEESKSEESK